MKGNPELQNGGLRALGEAWDDFLLEAFFCQVWSFSVFLGRVWVAPGSRVSWLSAGKPRVPAWEPRGPAKRLDGRVLDATGFPGISATEDW